MSVLNIISLVCDSFPRNIYIEMVLLELAFGIWTFIAQSLMGKEGFSMVAILVANEASIRRTDVCLSKVSIYLS